MESSTLDRNSSQAGLKTVRPESVRSRSPVAPPRTHERLRFPAEAGGNSLSEPAQRDLTAALESRAERAPHIPGAAGPPAVRRAAGGEDRRTSRGKEADS